MAKKKMTKAELEKHENSGEKVIIIHYQDPKNEMRWGFSITRRAELEKDKKKIIEDGMLNLAHI